MILLWSTVTIMKGEINDGETEKERDGGDHSFMYPFIRKRELGAYHPPALCD